MKSPGAMLDLDHDSNYLSLADAKTHIRLPQIQRATKGGRPECELSTWPIHSAPPYNAISYTWGDPSKTAEIQLNGKSTTVRANCADVLEQAYQCNRKRHIWVDALCINQNDVVEKSTQVAIMGHIYARAKQVLACIGKHEDGSESFMQELQRNRKLYYLVKKEGFKYSDTHQNGSIPRGLRAPIGRWLKRYSSSKGRGAQLLRAHNCFFNRPWFSRLWVVQEVFMGREIHVCCGQDAVPFDLLTGHLWIMEQTFAMTKSNTQTARRAWNRFAPWKGASVWSMSSQLFHMSTEEPTTQSALVELEVDRGKANSINRTFALVRGLTCENPLDKLYGVLALITWNGADPIVPDYQKSALQVALEFLGKGYIDADVDFDRITFRAAWLVENFRLDKSDGGVRHRLKALSSRRAAPAETPYKSDQRYKLYGRGFRLVCRTSDHGPPTRTFYAAVPRGYWQRFSLRESPACDTDSVDDILYGHLLYSADMRDGDWVIQLRSHDADFEPQREYSELSLDLCFLVARPHLEKGFQLVGYTTCEAFPNHFPYSLRFEHQKHEFSVWLDSEDLLMLAVHHSSFRNLLHANEGGKIDERQLLQIWSHRVCRFPYSSWAVQESRYNHANDEVNYGEMWREIESSPLTHRYSRV